MCGILCMVTNDCSSITHVLENLRGNLTRRGPDCQDTKKWSIGEKKHLYFLSSVLWMQGEHPVPQPIDNNKSIFQYNGNLYGGIQNEDIEKSGDTMAFLDILENANNKINILSTTKGPYSFIYFDKITNCLYFARDPLGRISLLIGKNDSTIVLASVGKKVSDLGFMELPSIGLFCWDLESDDLFLSPWKNKNQNFYTKVLELEHFLGKHIKIKDTDEYRTVVEYIAPDIARIKYIDDIRGLDVEQAFEFLLKDEKWLNNILKLKNLLHMSLKQRINKQPGYCRSCIDTRSVCNHSSVGILFSGGVDCAILAILSNKVVKKSCSIDLMNVSFDENNNYNSPDRQTGFQTLEELRKICPDREWRFLEINVSRKELDEKRMSHVSDLIFPLQTVMDDSLGCALWFASKGSTETYISPCRVVLAGMGADELFGGYTKHRAAFRKESWSGLHQSLEQDWQNLPYRNLARDNRMVCDHGRELRLPYLDENLVDFVRSLPVWEKTCPSSELQQGFGEKLLLRTLAYHIGLKSAAVLKKRALQFGSRIANKKENAHDISQRLLLS